ncbi:MAG: hypothetical protein COU81_02010, partial [Candidatus Portnoybacteria bacterium CG10_big_fil_rev_8_21_14_0_10_36_7]
MKDKFLLFDTDAIISIISYKAEKIFDELKSLNVTNCYIHPVYAELLRTQSNAERIKRQSVISKFLFQKLPLVKKDFDNASLIQIWLFNKQRYPSPTDLYMAGKLESYPHNDILLLTSNLNDFLHPLFKRTASIVLQNTVQTKII